MFDSVPYYRSPIPASYFREKGWRGRVILVANYIRARLQRWIEYRVMLLIAKQQSFDTDTVRALKLRWHEENVEQKRTRVSLGLLPQIEVGPPKSRYAEGRKNGRWPEDPVRQTNENLARAVAGSRGRKYGPGRDYSTLDVQEVEMEPVPAEKA